MNFKDKKKAYNDLYDVSALEADKKLLAKLNPASAMLHSGIRVPEKEAKAILWALLDVSSAGDIMANRPAKKTTLTVDTGDEAKEAAEAELASLDIDKAKQPVLAKIVRTLNLNVPDYKADTLRPVLESYRLTLQKEDEGDGKEKTPIVADPGKENELQSENEDMKEQLQELQDENDDLKEAVEKLEEELADEKKSQADPAGE